MLSIEVLVVAALDTHHDLEGVRNRDVGLVVVGGHVQLMVRILWYRTAQPADSDNRSPDDTPSLLDPVGPWHFAQRVIEEDIRVIRENGQERLLGILVLDSQQLEADDPDVLLNHPLREFFINASSSDGENIVVSDGSASRFAAAGSASASRVE
jgi:hypothetical protein